ncbi:hypothetical protein BH23GEM10_BH23GEM10_11190 [soil metagenome]
MRASSNWTECDVRAVYMFAAAAMLLLLLPLLMAAPVAGQARDAADAADAAWLAGETARAAELYAARLAADSTDGVALHRLALVHAWAGRYDESLVLFDRLLRVEPANGEARVARARVLAWAARFDEAERAWNEMLRAEPDDVAALLVLAQTLRWQARDAAALPVVQRAVALEPGNEDALTELHWIEAATSTRTTPGTVYERDSDGNSITTFMADAAMRMMPLVELRSNAYVRHATAAAPSPIYSRNAYGGMLTVWRQFEPGWTVSGSIGASSSDLADAPVRAAFAVGASTPVRDRVAVTAGLSRAALDGTALLIRRQVMTTEAAASLDARLGGGLMGRANGSIARFHSSVSGRSNRRVAAGASVSRLREPVTLAVRARMFAFEESDVFDGYFAPDFYGIAELAARYAVQRGSWRYLVEASPGIQKVRSGGEIGASVRGEGVIQYALRPGRHVALRAVLSNAGADALSPELSDHYRYRSIGLSGSWIF